MAAWSRDRAKAACNALPLVVDWLQRDAEDLHDASL